MYGLSASRILPTTCVHMWSVARVGSQASSGSAGQRRSFSVILGLLPITTVPSRPISDRRSLGSRACQSAKGRNKAVDVVLVVIDVRTDAHASDTWGDVDVLRRQLRDQPLWRAPRKAQAQDMRGAHAGIGNRH